MAAQAIGKTSTRLTDARALRGIAHPTRIALVALLRDEGAMTATQAAKRLGESPQRCTFHLNQLAKYGLVEEAGGGRGRERPWRATTFSTQWSHVAAGSEFAAAAQLLESVLAERYFEELMRWIDARSEESEEWQDAAAFGDTVVHLTAHELADLNRQVRSLVEQFIERTVKRELRPEDSRSVTFLHLAFPTRGPLGSPIPPQGRPASR